MKTIRYTVPIFVMLCVTGAALADAGHEHMHGGQQTAAAPAAHWMAPEEAAKRSNPVAADQESLERGKKLFKSNCASCHGASGRGDGPAGVALNPKPVDLTVMAGQHPDGDFAWKIANGRGPMPAWKGTLTNNQIWDLVNYIQSLGKPTASHGGHQHAH